MWFFWSELGPVDTVHKIKSEVFSNEYIKKQLFRHVQDLQLNIFYIYLLIHCINK